MDTATRSPQRVLTTLGCALLALVTSGAFAQPGAPLPAPPTPPENPITTAKINLGKVLFWDEQLSSTRTVACGTCHIPSGGNSDPRTAVSPVATAPGPDALFGTADDILGSPGVPQSLADGTYSAHASFGILEQATTRRSRAASEAGYASSLFWDGRAGDVLIDPQTAATIIPAGAALESQALGPILSEVEMAYLGRSWSDVVDRLSGAEPLALAADLPAELDSWIGNRNYPALFAEAFGDASITPTRIAMAIATYERTLVSNQTPLDVANAGGAPLTPLQQQGRTVFAGSCGGCHAPPLFSDDLFHYIGVRPVNDDLGRFALTGAPIDRGAMRTPSLRNVGLRAPFMHNGSLASLEDVVDFYDRGGDFDAPNKPPIIQPLGLTPAEKTALVTFLREALTDPRTAAELPPFDRPGLFTESGWLPEVVGAGIPGAGGLEPQVVALEPPFAGNPSFTVGVWGSVPAATAFLAIDTTDPGLTPPPAADFAWVEVPLTAATTGAGSASVSLAIPDDETTRGTTYFGRWYVPDPAAAGGTAVSALLTFTVIPTRRGAGSEIFADGFDSGSTGRWSEVAP